MQTSVGTSPYVKVHAQAGGARQGGLLGDEPDDVPRLGRAPFVDEGLPTRDDRGGTPAAVTWFVNPTTAEHSSQRTLEVHVTLVMAVSIGWAVLISALVALVCLVARHNR
jgi:hypothetical protein